MKRARNILIVAGAASFLFGMFWSISAREGFAATESTLYSRIGMHFFEHIEYEGYPVIAAYAMWLGALTITIKENCGDWIDSFRRRIGKDA